MGRDILKTAKGEVVIVNYIHFGMKRNIKRYYEQNERLLHPGSRICKIALDEEAGFIQP